MGFFQRLFGALGMSSQACKILVVGLDDAGKTTIMNRIMPQKGQPTEVVPTVGFHAETFDKGSLKFTVFDMSGAGQYRDLWGQKYAEADAVIFVIDCKDKIRVCIAKNELDNMLAHEDLAQKRTPILFFANKMDIAGCLNTGECSDALDLHRIKDKPWHIAHSNGLTGDGIPEGVAWLTDKLLEAHR